jgi:hypothetical protein
MGKKDRVDNRKASNCSNLSIQSRSRSKSGLKINKRSSMIGGTVSMGTLPTLKAF